MTEVRFYHLTRKRLEEALPELLEKVMKQGQRAVVMAASSERVEALTRHLWTYRENSFLPHGSAADGFAKDQPIWLTEREENPNGAKILFLTDGAAAASFQSFDLVCEIFEESNPQAVEAARGRWQQYKTANHALTYWQQGEKGWEKKA
jgi:DNA polymerase-3 subunit chi